MAEAMARVEILRIGAEGDGIAEIAGKPLFVPFTLPGEVAEVRPGQNGRARLLRLLKTSPQRLAPQCRYFGGEEACGGCALQHWQAAPYQDWKRQQIFTAFAKAGLKLRQAQVRPLFPALPGARRRLILTAKIQPGRVELGFNKAQSHEIIAIDECPVARPQLAAALPILRAALKGCRPRRDSFHLTLTAAENGLDAALQQVVPPLAEEEKLRLSNFFLKSAGDAGSGIECAGDAGGGAARAGSAAAGQQILRLTADEELIFSRKTPIIHFGRAAVELPAGGFLQASAAAEAEMALLAANALKKCKNIADLFAGCGSFTFRLAEQANIHAVEWDKAALASLERAAAQAAGAGQSAAAAGDKAKNLKKISWERRDLFQRPLIGRELAAYDGLIFDPPRAGAEAQAREIAKSAIKAVAAVSCNPATLARDAAILLAGGYYLETITPIDQFLWSPHIEAVAIFSKRPAKKGWTL